ncbi:MAG: hypothetical protein ACREPX_09130, partial [Rhodanobacteraceae bacterium]
MRNSALLLASLGAINASAAGAAKPGAYSRSPSPSEVLEETWIEQKTTAVIGAPYMDFGSAATVQRSTAVIGARGENERTGAAYVFNRSGGQWIEAQRIAADDGVVGDEFGYRAVLADTTLIVTAFNATVEGSPFQGAAYVYQYQAGEWAQSQKLVAADGALFDDFGAAIAMDGDSAIIGAIGTDTMSGAAYVFERVGDTWSQSQRLDADDGAAYDDFGVSAAIKREVAMIGADNAMIDGVGRGAV